VGTSVNYSPEFNAPEPNLSLLNRLAEIGHGRVLDPANPADNPFHHDRSKTYQPKDLWEWLLRLGIVLFTLDVGVRRIQLDREEILKGLAFLRRKLLFWETERRPVQADESLAALLHRRDQVRAVRPQPAPEATAELFRPKTSGTLPQTEATPEKPAEASESIPGEEPSVQKPIPTTSRLLEAKRRAQRKKGSE